MHTNHYQPLLHQIERYVSLTDADKEHIMKAFRYRQVRRRQLIVQAGDVCIYESYVLSGALKCSTTDRKGTEHILHFAIEDCWAADQGSFWTQKPATWDIETTEDCELLQIDHQTAQQLYKLVPAYERFDRMAFQEAYVALQNRIFSIYSQTTEERYATFLQKYPGLHQRFAQKHIASYLGVTPEHFSKIRQQVECTS